jgi:RHS repeat-associated protein
LALSSVARSTDTEPVNTYIYDPYGNLTALTGTVANPFRFAGEYYDTATGLYKIGARLYDPADGRWTTADPVLDQLNSHGANAYDYANDDPINFADPSGMFSLWHFVLGLDSAAEAAVAAGFGVGILGGCAAAGVFTLGIALVAAPGCVLSAAAAFASAGFLAYVTYRDFEAAFAHKSKTAHSSLRRCLLTHPQRPGLCL